MGFGYFSASSTVSTPSGKPVTWFGRCRGVVVTTEQQSWFEARERLIAEMGAMGFGAEEVEIREGRSTQ